MPLASSPEQPMETEGGVVLTPLYSPSSSHRRFTEIPKHSDVQKHIVGVRRQLADLPLPPKQMNLVSLVCMYTLMGLSDRDIAVAVGSTEDRIGNIKMLDAYTTVYHNVTESIVNEEVDDVRTLLVSKSKTAAQRMVSLLDDEFSAIQLAAARDILDRTGLRPVDIVEHRHSMEGELRISITRDDKIDASGVPLDAEGL